AAGGEVMAAVDRLERIADALVRRFPGTPLHVDLAELRGYRYHTGV
ncbi:MAG: ATP phosphoribosyltransferase regulatory subunit, partial [Gammaproteobacteria bacterium]|nr:ATP phosphoribosyltransferase regulatory subunit [Gammaproteobacteria bacterium]